MLCKSIEICQISPKHFESLKNFFELLKLRGVDRFFHPHPLSADAARERATYVGSDLYFLMLEGEAVVGYGMLRGWDEGYEIPSLGIAVHPDLQGQGFGRLLMEFLRVAACRRGATQIRLRVSRENKTAIALYQSLGYKLAPDSGCENMIGILELS